MAGSNIKNDIFKTVPIKGKGKGNVEVCNFDKKIIIQPKDKMADVEKKVDACYDKKPKQSPISVGVPTLQAPENEWMVLQDTNFYKVPDNQKGTIEKQQGKAMGRITKVKANLVFVRYQGTLRKMLKMDKNAPYNFIDADVAIPYYQYVLKNKSQYQIDPKGFEMIAWAEGIDKKVKGGQLSFNGDDSSFTGNTNLDLSFDGNTALDLSFDGNTNLDLGVDGEQSNCCGVDGEESGADGEYFYIVKPKTKIFAKDKKTGIVHNTGKKLGKGSKVKGKLTKGVNKFRVKNKKSNTISTINKASGFVIIGENDLAQMLVPVGSIKPINLMKSSFSGDDSNLTGNTNLDLDFDGNTNLDLGVDGSRKKLTPEQRAARKARRKAKIAARRAKHQANRAARKARRMARKAKKHSFDGNTALDLSFDGNTNLDLSIQGGNVKYSHGRRRNLTPEQRAKRAARIANLTPEQRAKRAARHAKRVAKGLNKKYSFEGNTNLDLGFDGNTNLDLSFDGNTNLDLSFVGRHANQGRHLGANRGKHIGATVGSSFNGGALNEDFHGGGDMLYFDGSEEMSNAFGDWFKKQKEKRAIKKLEKKEKKALSKEEAAVLANENKVVFTEDEMKAVYKSSGSTKPFNEWTKGEGAKNFFNSIAQFGAAFLQNKSKESAGEPTEGSTENIVDEKLGGDAKKGEKTILGMHPLTFGLVAVGVGLALVGVIMIANKGNKSVPIPAPVG